MPLTPVRLSAGNCPKGFSCGDKDLDEFLTDDAVQQAKLQMNETTLLFDEGVKEPVAYVTLLADTIDKRKWKDEKLPQGLEQVPYSKWPAVLIGRLGVTKDRQKSDAKYGMQVFDYVLGMTGEVAIGIRFITVDSYESARGFYEKLGFKPTPGSHRKEGGGVLSMFYDIVASGEIDEEEGADAAAASADQGAKPAS